MAKVTQLLTYPVKSLRGFSSQSARLTPQGLEYDRQWMIINTNNQFVTQRKLASMVLIHTQIHNHQLILSKPSTPELPPLIINIASPPQGEPFSATVWKDTCQVIDEGPLASHWLQSALNYPDTLRLVRMGNTPRPQSKPELLGAHTHTYFADAAPYLVVTEESLAALNQQLLNADLSAVTIERFRPNIVLKGLAAFTEHQIKDLHHPHYHLQHCYPCQRCVIPTINLDTGQRHPKQQPFSLIADINAMPNNPKAPSFGENAILISGANHTICCGDELHTH